MKSIIHNSKDPFICSCLPNSKFFFICNQVKWSTLSIGIALLIIIVYLTSGLYSLVDVTSIVATQSTRPKAELSLWPISSSSLITILGWTSASVYLFVVLVVTILLCGIQLNKPWLLLLWSIVMVFMILIDGVVTVLSVRENQIQNYRSAAQSKILYFVMCVRLIVSLVGIFVTVFHFRRLNKINKTEKARQRILDRYNHDQSPTPSYHESWARHVSMPRSNKGSSDTRHHEESFPPLTLPRAKVATVEQHPTTNRYMPSYNSPTEYTDHRLQQQQLQPSNTDTYDDFRYNIPLQERFHQEQIRNSRLF